MDGDIISSEKGNMDLKQEVKLQTNQGIKYHQKRATWSLNRKLNFKQTKG
jgi:hypothetical protein